MRQEYEMTEEEFNEIRDASKPVPYMVFGGREPMTPQENANAAWKQLAAKRGFKWDSVERSSKGIRFFTAEELQ